MNDAKHNVRRHKLARQILALAQEQGWPEGHHVTEQSLAAAIGVSRTPVRAALDLLASRGAMRFRPNYGYFLATRDAGAAEIEIPATEGEKLYLAIIDARMRGDLDEVVTQSDLMARFCTGRHLVQQALTRLADEGLIGERKGRAWTFKPAFDGFSSWDSSYQLRLALEPQALLLPQFKIDRTRLGRARRAHLGLLSALEDQSAPRQRIYEIDSGFHEMIAEFSQNPFFLAAIRHQDRLRRLFEFGVIADFSRVAAWCHEHLAIIDALEQNQAGKASELMHLHLTRAREASVAWGTEEPHKGTVAQTRSNRR